MKKRTFKIITHFIITFLLICSTAFQVRAQSGEPTGTIPFKITSLDYAYDKLIVSYFGSDYSTTGILSKTVTKKGTYTIQTARKQVELGTGPGWLFYQEDRSRLITMHIFFLITEDGQIYRKTLKDPPLDMTSYKPVASTWDLRSKEIPDLKTSDQAYNWLVHQQFGHTVGNRRIYLYPRKVTDGLTVDNRLEKFVLSGGPGWLFFVDYWPRETWGQNDYLFVLVTESGQFVSRWAGSPPTGLSQYIKLTEPMPATPLITPSVTKLSKSIPAVQGMAAESPSNRWAVIISGGGSKDGNWVRYWNDSSFFYKTLIAHGFLKDNIYLLISDGENPDDDQIVSTGVYANSSLDLDEDGVDELILTAEEGNIVFVFNELQTLLDEDDILYVFTTDHGGADKDGDCQFDRPRATLVLWNDAIITDQRFSIEVNKVNTLATVCIFEQCFSGGMMDELMRENRVLMSGARFWETSKMGSPSPAPCADYDEYAYHMINALANPSLADRDEDGAVSMEEGHFHAMANKHKESEELDPRVGCDYNPGEHPSYYSNPWDLGRKISLNGLNSCNAPPLMGSYIQEEISEPFPTGGTAQGWHADENLWQYDLPFSFPFYGNDYTKIWVESNGIINFADSGSTDYENSIKKLKSKLAIAPLWDDLTTTEPGDDIFIGWADPWLTIRWQAHTIWDVVRRPVNVAVKLNKNGKIKFLYGEGNRHTTLIKQRDKTIGLSKGDGTDFILCLRNGAPDLGFAEGIEFTPYEFVFVDGAWGGPHYGTRNNPFANVMDGYNAINNWGALFIRTGSYNSSYDVPITMSKEIQIINYDGVVTIGE